MSHDGVPPRGPGAIVECNRKRPTRVGLYRGGLTTLYEHLTVFFIGKYNPAVPTKSLTAQMQHLPRFDWTRIKK